MFIVVIHSVSVYVFGSCFDGFEVFFSPPNEIGVLRLNDELLMGDWGWFFDAFEASPHSYLLISTVPLNELSSHGSLIRL
jgi:hypothetical protein